MAYLHLLGRLDLQAPHYSGLLRRERSANSLCFMWECWVFPALSGFLPPWIIVHQVDVTPCLTTSGHRLILPGVLESNQDANVHSFGRSKRCHPLCDECERSWPRQYLVAWPLSFRLWACRQQPTM